MYGKGYPIMKNMLALLAILTAVAMGFAGPAVSQTIDLAFEGSGVWSYISKFDVQGDYAFCAMKHGLMIVDISDPAHPEPVSYYYISEGEGSDVEVFGHYACLAAKKAGLIIFDIDDIHNPLPVALYDAVYSAEFVNLFGDYAMVSDGSFGFHLVDISDPTNPTMAGQYEDFMVTPPFDVVVRGNYMIGAFYGGMLIYDISDIAHPVLDTTFSTDRSTRGMAVADTLVYLVTDTAFQIVNISNPHNPTAVGSGPCLGRDIEIIGDYAVIASVTQLGKARGFFVYDISDPSAPDSAGFLDRPVSRLASDGNYIYAGDIVSFIDIIDLDDPAEPAILGSFTTPNGGTYGMRNLVTDGRYAYMAYGYAGVVIADISDPANPEVIADNIIPNRASNIVLKDHYIYVTSDAYDGEGLHIIDIANPAAPNIVGHFDYQSPQEVALYGDYAILAGNYGNANIVDISRPALPAYVSQFRLGGITYGMVASGNYLYAANWMHYLKTIDLSDIEAPAVIDSIYITPVVYDVIVYKDYLLLSTAGGIYFYDITTDPASPTQAGFFAINSDCYRMTPYGDYLFVSAGYSEGLVILDMTAPLFPVVAGSQTISGTVKGTAIFDHHAFVIDANGLIIFSCDIPTCCTLGGDANYNGQTDIGDCVYLLNYIFKEGLPVNCFEAADASGNCSIDIGDVVFIINYLARGGPAAACGDCSE